MKTHHLKRGFSLVEVTLAIGIAAFTLLAVFGLFPIGMNASHNASEQSVAANAAAAIIADLRETPWTAGQTTVYKIPPNVGGTIRLDDAGVLAPNSDGRYRATIRVVSKAVDALPAPDADMNPASHNPTRLGIVTITWPANATVANALGKYEQLFALPRKD